MLLSTCFTTHALYAILQTSIQSGSVFVKTFILKSSSTSTLIEHGRLNSSPECRFFHKTNFSCFFSLFYCFQKTKHFVCSIIFRKCFRIEHPYSASNVAGDIHLRLV